MILNHLYTAQCPEGPEYYFIVNYPNQHLFIPIDTPDDVWTILKIDAIELSNDAIEVGNGLHSVWVDVIELQSGKVEETSKLAISSFCKSVWSETGLKLGSIKGKSDGIKVRGDRHSVQVKEVSFWSAKLLKSSKLLMLLHWGCSSSSDQSGPEAQLILLLELWCDCLFHSAMNYWGLGSK